MNRLFSLTQLTIILSCYTFAVDSDSRGLMTSMPPGIRDGCAREVSITSSIVSSSNGVDCDLNELTPYSVFSEGSWTVSDNQTIATNTVTGETVNIALWSGMCSDGTTSIKAMKEDDLWKHIEIYSDNNDDEYLVMIDSELDTTLYLSYGENCIDEVLLHENGVSPPADTRRMIEEEGRSTSLRSSLRANRQRNIQSSCAKDASSSSCSCYQVVEIGIVYDREFCQEYGSKTAAVNGIQMIIADASRPYENDLCIQLKLANAVGYGFDDNCNLDGSRIDFSVGFGRDKPCDDGSGQLNFLDSFTAFMTANNKEKRSPFPNAGLVHLFSGGVSASGAAGCAWIGTTCSASYGYGVDYIGKMKASPESQATIVAHELGHNFGGVHIPQDTPGNFIMKPAVASTHDRFSPETKQKMLEKINAVTCDYQSSTNRAPGPAPTPSSNDEQCTRWCNSSSDCGGSGCAGFTCDYRFEGNGYAGRCSAGQSKYAKSRSKRRCRTNNGITTGGARCNGG